MRVSWHLSIGVLLVGIWPHLGCLLTQPDKAIPPEQPKEKSASAKIEMSPEAMSPADKAAELERAGKFREAIAVYEKMRAPGSPDALLATKLLAALYLRNGDLERAEQEYLALHKLNPQDAGVLTFLGDISSRRGHWGSAEQAYSEALRHQPENVSARSGLAMSLAQQCARAKTVDEFNRAYARSVAEFKKVLKSEADAQCEVAFVMKMQGKQVEAMKAYQTALTLEPNNARARTEVAALKQKGVPDAPATIVRMTTPLPATGIAELVPAMGPQMASEGMSRLQAQRPSLPPLDEAVTETDNSTQRK